MPAYLAPGTYDVANDRRARVIAPIDLPVTVFIGPTRRGPVGQPSPVLRSFAEFRRVYGGLGALRLDGNRRLLNHVAHAARCFFDEGGGRLRVVRVSGGHGGVPSLRGYLTALRKVSTLPGLRTVAAPGSSALPLLADPVRRALLAHALKTAPKCFALLDPRPTLQPAEVRTLASTIDSAFAALYYPWIMVRNPSTGRDLAVPPSGPLAGVIARTDRERGLHRSPANTLLRSATGLVRTLSAAQSDQLNPAGVNAIRRLPGRGIRVWGARTLSSEPEWRYVSIRRYLASLEHAIRRGIGWVGSESNDPQLWATVRLAVGDFLYQEWRAGRLPGARPEEAFFVRCDRSTMTPSEIANCRLVVSLGCAALKPAEFVMFRITHRTG
jgi:phage tail sheath protein FI